MIPRTRMLITAVFACHLLLAPAVVTSQLPQAVPGIAGPAGPAQAGPPASPAEQQRRSEEAFAPPRPGEEITIKAKVQEKEGALWRLRGDVEIGFRDFVLRAGEIEYNSDTGDVRASGLVTLDGGPNDEHIQASRGDYNIRTNTGRFYDVVATTGARFEGRGIILTSSAPFAFTGKMVERTSDHRYIVHHGTVTSCALPNPIWTFNAQRVVVDVGDTARIYHSSFRIKKIPVFYFPYAQHPVDNLGRKSGFLVPVVGNSSRKGFTLGESYYWAINRSADLTLGAEFYSRRGWAQNGEFRARPSDTSFIQANYFGVIDRGVGTPPVDQGGQDITLVAEAQFPRGFRGVANLNYLSSYVFRLAFTEQFSQAVNSEVKSVAFLSRTYRGFSMNSMMSRYQNFQSDTRGDLITIVHVPTFETNTVDWKLPQTPLRFGFDAALEGVSRREPVFKTSSVVGRFDVRPRASLPVFFKDWSFRPEVALRNTYYTQRRVPDSGVGQPVTDPVNRRAIEASFELRPPALSRVYQRNPLGRAIKHTIEPRFTYQYVSGVQNFQNIIRFDARDIMSDTNEVEYALVQRLYMKRGRAHCPTQPPPATLEKPANAEQKPVNDCVPPAREVLRWELAQKYFMDNDFGGALVPGRRNVFTSTAEFAGIAFLTEPRRFSPIISRLRVLTGASTDVQWNLDYDPKLQQISSSTAFLNYRLGNYFVGGSHVFLRVPGEVFTSTQAASPDRFNQFRLLLGYGHPNKRGISIAGNVGYDVRLDFVQYSSVQATYNWDCCGLTVEMRRLALGTVRPGENQLRFAFTLANIGTFGNLRRQERLF